MRPEALLPRRPCAQRTATPEAPPPRSTIHIRFAARRPFPSISPPQTRSGRAGPGRASGSRSSPRCRRSGRSRGSSRRRISARSLPRPCTSGRSRQGAAHARWVLAGHGRNGTSALPLVEASGLGISSLRRLAASWMGTPASRSNGSVGSARGPIAVGPFGFIKGARPSKGRANGAGDQSQRHLPPSVCLGRTPTPVARALQRLAPVRPTATAGASTPTSWGSPCSGAKWSGSGPRERSESAEESQITVPRPPTNLNGSPV